MKDFKDNQDNNNLISTIIGWSVDALLYIPRLIINLLKALF